MLVGIVGEELGWWGLLVRWWELLVRSWDDGECW